MQTWARSQKDSQVLKRDLVEVRQLSLQQCLSNPLPCLSCCLALKATKTEAFPPKHSGHLSSPSTTRHWCCDGTQEEPEVSLTPPCATARRVGVSPPPLSTLAGTRATQTQQGPTSFPAAARRLRYSPSLSRNESTSVSKLVRLQEKQLYSLG